MGLFGNLLGKKKDKIELDASDMTDDERALVLSMIQARKERKLVEVEG